MRCPWCQSDDDKVVDSRPAAGGHAVRRRRACTACGQRFTTLERVEHAPLVVRKRNDVVEAFDTAKLARGIESATANLPLDDDRRRQAVATVEARVRGLGQREVSSRQIGLEVLDVLRTIDPVAYVRFASVYKGFQTPDDFARELARLDKASPPKARRRTKPRSATGPRT